MLADRHDDVVSHRERGEQCAVLELHADVAEQLLFGPAMHAAGVLAEDLDLAGAQRIEAEDGAQQYRLAGARAANQPDHLAAEDVEVEVVVHDMVAELGADAAQLEHDFPAVAMVDELAAFHRLAFLRRLARLDRHTLASRKMMENTASSTITQKIDSTTERVVSWPTLSALPLTCSPSKQPIAAMMKPNTGDLIMPV